MKLADQELYVRAYADYVFHRISEREFELQAALLKTK